MSHVTIREQISPDKRVKIAVFTYTGQGDPTHILNLAVHQYVKTVPYNEYVDAHLDNPWVRVIIRGLNDWMHENFNPLTHSLI